MDFNFSKHADSRRLKRGVGYAVVGFAASLANIGVGHYYPTLKGSGLARYSQAPIEGALLYLVFYCFAALCIYRVLRIIKEEVLFRDSEDIESEVLDDNER